MELPSKNSIRKAGKRVASLPSIQDATDEDMAILDEWRKAHLQPLNAIAMWLRKPAQNRTAQAPAQRLKRRDTFLDKLHSGRARDASSMNDLGGCRLIFPTLSDLHSFRKYLEIESRAHHKLSHDRSKYDYITSPKPTGYRGVHYVYEYRTTVPNRIYMNGLKIEVQLRTDIQHAWATAVEIADLVSDTRTKFEDGTGQYGEFFRLASELLARHHEDMKSCCADMVLSEVKDRFLRLEDEVHLLDRLGKLKEQGDISKIKQHTILAFMEDDTVDIFGYTKLKRAVAKEEELLGDKACTNVVYVSAPTPVSIRNSYRNYLTNPADFVKLLHQALE